MQGKVSMVMPCYNKVQYIGEMFDSIIAQDWDNIELILVNDGSTDGTREVITQYEPRFRGRGFEVVIVDQANAGVCAAAKAGLERITGDYVCMVDADDELDPKYVSTMAGWLEAHREYDYTMCGKATYTGNGKNKSLQFTGATEVIYGDPYLVERSILWLFSVFVWVFMVRASYLRKCRIVETYYTATKGTHEPGYTIPLLAYGGKFKFFPLPLYRYNVGDEGHSRPGRFDGAVAFQEEHYKLYINVINALPDSVASASKKRVFSATAAIYRYLSIYKQAVILADGFPYKEFYMCKLIEVLNTEIGITPPLTRKNVEGSEELLVRAISPLLLGSDKFTVSLSTGKIIGYGALGRNARMLLPYLKGTLLEPNELWDMAGDGVMVKKPDMTTLNVEDTVLVFPRKTQQIVKLQDDMREKGCIVFDFSHLTVFAALQRFPQLNNRNGEAKADDVAWLTKGEDDRYV